MSEPAGMMYPGCALRRQKPPPHALWAVQKFIVRYRYLPDIASQFKNTDWFAAERINIFLVAFCQELELLK
jgi:hypothetical protein